MDIKEYKQAVIELFKGGNATEEQWQEMADAVLYVSETDPVATLKIDGTIFGFCDICNEPTYDQKPCEHEMFSEEDVAHRQKQLSTPEAAQPTEE